MSTSAGDKRSPRASRSAAARGSTALERGSPSGRRGGSLTAMGRNALHCASCVLGAASPGRCPFVPVTRAAGAVICEAGEPARAVYFVREGLVSLTRPASDGGEGALTLRGASSMCGLDALGGQASVHEVRAFTGVKLCAATAEAICRWLGERSPAGALAGLLVAELGRGSEEARLREGSPTARVARFALTHRPEAGSPRRLPKRLVAQMLGIRPETLSRCLTKLRLAGVLDGTDRWLPLDRARLAALAEG